MMTNRNGSKPVCMKNRTPGDRGNSRPMMSNAIEFLDLTGARFSEVERANVGDVDLETKTIRFRRKGGRDQVVGLNQVAVEAIREELESRGLPEASAPLFTNRLK